MVRSNCRGLRGSADQDLVEQLREGPGEGERAGDQLEEHDARGCRCRCDGRPDCAALRPAACSGLM